MAQRLAIAILTAAIAGTLLLLLLEQLFPASQIKRVGAIFAAAYFLPGWLAWRLTRHMQLRDRSRKQGQRD